MNGIEQVLRSKLEKGQKGFIPFFTAGDPDVESSLSVVLTLAELGADVIELGVPFSDPMADGPTIQRSSQRALEHGMSIASVLDLAERVRAESDVPIVIFSYLNPILSLGVEQFGRRCREIGIEGVLVTDVVDEEAAEIAASLRAYEVALIRLVASTTSDERLERICEHAEGFIYAVSRAGVTGAQAESSTTAEDLVGRIRRLSDVPVAVGFGISTREQVADVWRYADAAIVGSAIVAEVEAGIEHGNVVDRVRSFVTALMP